MLSFSTKFPNFLNPVGHVVVLGLENASRRPDAEIAERPSRSCTVFWKYQFA
jgi:hypothetical protein